MSRAVLLCLQHPQVVSQVPADDIEISHELRGADVLLKLIGFCDADPAISTARLLERFNDTEQYPYLVKLATKTYWPDGRELSTDTANAEFVNCIKRLKERSKQTLVDKVEHANKLGLLGIGKR